VGVPHPAAATATMRAPASAKRRPERDRMSVSLPISNGLQDPGPGSDAGGRFGMAAPVAPDAGMSREQLARARARKQAKCVRQRRLPARRDRC
jgi:hypothetical protein